MARWWSTGKGKSTEVGLERAGPTHVRVPGACEAALAPTGCSAGGDETLAGWMGRRGDEEADAELMRTGCNVWTLMRC